MFLYPLNINWLEEVVCAEVRSFSVLSAVYTELFYNISFNWDND